MEPQSGLDSPLLAMVVTGPAAPWTVQGPGSAQLGSVPSPEQAATALALTDALRYANKSWHSHHGCPGAGGLPGSHGLHAGSPRWGLAGMLPSLGSVPLRWEPFSPEPAPEQLGKAESCEPTTALLHS